MGGALASPAVPRPSRRRPRRRGDGWGREGGRRSLALGRRRREREGTVVARRLHLSRAGREGKIKGTNGAVAPAHLLVSLGRALASGGGACERRVERGRSWGAACLVPLSGAHGEWAPRLWRRRVWGEVVLVHGDGGAEKEALLVGRHVHAPVHRRQLAGWPRREQRLMPVGAQAAREGVLAPVKVPVGVLIRGLVRADEEAVEDEEAEHCEEGNERLPPCAATRVSARGGGGGECAPPRSHGPRPVAAAARGRRAGRGSGRRTRRSRARRRRRE